MNTPSLTQTEEWQGQLNRAIEEFDRRKPELFDPFEEVFCIPNANSLGVWIGIKSVHGRHRLETVHRLIFRGFSDDEGRWTDNEGFEWVHFGFFRPSVRPEKAGAVVRFVSVTDKIGND